VQWGGCWHCGLNDARNKARLLAELMQRGVTISSTGSLAGALTRRFGDKFA
jgi:ERI1 exoribonuclease 2